MSFEHDTTFRSMGCEIRLMLGEPLGSTAASQDEASARERAFIEDLSVRLSRFRPDSELSALNADPRAVVPATPLLRAAVGAGVWAANRTGGLVDPTLVDALENGGYAASREGQEPASLAEALRSHAVRAAARPHPARHWQSISVDHVLGSVVRPPGVRIDTGGTGKGLAADAVAHRLRGFARFVVDCGGDIAVGGSAALKRPFEIAVEHPLTGEHVHTLTVARGGVATSGLNVRIWRRQDGSFAHHLLDPSTGEPAWTGLIGVTALGASALEAETTSKHALLSGPVGARAILSECGGLIVHDDGDVELVGPVRERPRLRLSVPSGVAA